MLPAKPYGQELPIRIPNSGSDHFDFHLRTAHFPLNEFAFSSWSNTAGGVRVCACHGAGRCPAGGSEPAVHAGLGKRLILTDPDLNREKRRREHDRVPSEQRHAETQGDYATGALPFTQFDYQITANHQFGLSGLAYDNIMEVTRICAFTRNHRTSRSPVTSSAASLPFTAVQVSSISSRVRSGRDS